MQKNHFRGWQMASSDKKMRFGGGHRRHWRLQLGRVRERGLLGGVLLRRRLVQQRNFALYCGSVDVFVNNCLPTTLKK